MEVADPAPVAAVHRVVDVPLGDGAGDGVGHAGVDPLPLPRRAGVTEGGEGEEAEEVGDAVVRPRPADLAGPAVRAATRRRG